MKAPVKSVTRATSAIWKNYLLVVGGIENAGVLGFNLGKLTANDTNYDNGL